MHPVNHPVNTVIAQIGVNLLQANIDLGLRQCAVFFENVENGTLENGMDFFVPDFLSTLRLYREYRR